VRAARGGGGGVGFWIEYAFGFCAFASTEIGGKEQNAALIARSPSIAG
jgi:hypothetical protein